MHKTSIIIAVLLLGFPTLLFAHPRIITNLSDSTWLILVSKHDYPNPIDFNTDPTDSIAGNGCSPGSHVKADVTDLLEQQFCFLPPHQTTHVEYYSAGTLMFTFQGDRQAITVEYALTSFDGVGMYSSDPIKINDNHGNITIFKGADNT